MEDLKATLEANPHITEVHYTDEINYSFIAHDVKGQLVINGKPIIKTLKRDEILGAAIITNEETIVEKKKGKK
jgi:hypothetical protein